MVFPVIAPQMQDDFDLDSELDAVKDLLKTPKYPTQPPRPVRKPVMQNVSPVDVEKNRRSKAPLTIALVLVILMAVGFFSYWFYNNYYLVSVNGITVSGSQTELTVTLDTQIADSLLSVSCTDAYGSAKVAQVSGRHCRILRSEPQRPVQYPGPRFRSAQADGTDFRCVHHGGPDGGGQHDRSHRPGRGQRPGEPDRQRPRPGGMGALRLL